jgi:hypothetical protein
MTISANFSLTRPSLLLDFSNQTVLDPRVTFARTTTALFYDNKSAALAEQNLLLQSNTFTNAYWLPLGATVAQNVTDPAGTASGAYTLTATNTTNYHNLGMTATSVSFGVATYTISAYLQAGTNSYVSLIVNSGSSNYVTATFNLPTGLSQAVVSSGNMAYVAGSVLFTQIGSTSWYRCSFQFTNSATQTGGISVQINNTATPSIGNFGLQAQWLSSLGTETILAYGLQLEQAKNLTTYTPSVYTATTATAVNTYTPTLQTAAINAPRFDYNPTTRESLGLLLEQASTNLALYSSDYTNAAWTKTACTITATADISPDGTQNASLMVLGTTSVARYFYQSTTFTAAAYTVSVYLKYYGQRFVQIISQANGTVLCNFDLIDGTAGTPSGSGSPTASIQNAGNGWYRCSITYTATAVSANNLISASNSLTATANPAFAGNGFNGYLIWGAQVEAAPSATSYIATVASAQTRTVDSASMTGTNFTSWYNYSGGTVYVEASTGYLNSGGNPVAAINDNSSNSSATNYIYSALATSGVEYRLRLNGTTLLDAFTALPSTLAVNTFYKTAYYYSTTGTGVSSAGQTATTTSTSVSIPAVNQLTFGSFPNGVGIINGRIKKFAYYPLALTNTQIQSLSAN